MLVSIYIYLQLFTHLWDFYLNISIYNYVEHYKSLQSIQDTNHPKCSIVYTNHPAYTYVH